MKEIVITLLIAMLLVTVILVCMVIATAEDDPAWDEWEKTENWGDDNDN